MMGIDDVNDELEGLMIIIGLNIVENFSRSVENFLLYSATRDLKQFR